MTYSEEEIKKYLSILQNFDDGLDVYSVRYKHILPKIPQKVSCENCGNTHFFKDKGFRYCNKCFYSLGRVFVVMLSVVMVKIRPQCYYTDIGRYTLSCVESIL